MTADLRALVDPGHTALVTQECQNGVIGDGAVFPALADAARAELLPNLARLVPAARAAGVQVVHCLAVRRPDSLGANANARLFGAVLAAPVALVPGSAAAALVDAIPPDESDLVMERFHGLGPMSGTGLDPVLRNLGVRTIVGVGVSVNVGMTNFVMDAVNNGYQFVLPADAVAGVPAAYSAAVIENTLKLLATLTTTDALIEAWR